MSSFDTNEDAVGKIGCAICGARTHMIEQHIKEAHPGVSLDEYKLNYPDAPLLSVKAVKALAVRGGAGAPKKPEADATDKVAYGGGYSVSKASFHELFDLGAVKAALSRAGTPIAVHVIEAPEDMRQYLFRRDPNYVWNIDLLKRAMLGIEMNIPTFFWGHAGTGKSTLAMQICSVTGRPGIRVQHTANTEESHILGGWRVRDGATIFELGPLPYAMKHGLTYIADEYDFGMPQVLSVYQPVLEGNPLIIKEADPANRVIEPHPLFRFIATGNTNGAGDETGLYQGTVQQNAANFERFGMVEEVRYPEKAVEVSIVAGQGGILAAQAEQLVSFAAMVREAFTNGKIGAPVSPRALINAAKIGKRLGSLSTGLACSYINRLSRVDQEAVRQIVSRIGLE